MTTAQDSIGTPGTPWGDAERALWRSRQSRRRSYVDDVLGAIEHLRARFDVVEYGRLDYPPDSYPLLAVRSRDWNDDLPCVLVTRSEEHTSELQSLMRISSAVFCLKKKTYKQ